MGESLDEFLEIILYKNDGRLNKLSDFIAFHGLEEILAGFSYVLLQNFEYKPVFKVVYESSQIPIEYNKDQKYIFRTRKGYVIYNKEGDPRDNLVISIEEIQNLPIFIRNLDKKNINLFFYLDEEPISYVLKSKEYPIFDFISTPISKVSLEYFSESNIIKLDIGSIRSICSYPIIIKIKDLDEFLKLIETSMIKELEIPNYII